MASPVSAQLILCDAAVADGNGKIHMLGAGWSTTTSPTAASAVAVLMKIPWDRANHPLQVSLKLLSSDGVPLLLPTGNGSVAVGHEGTIEVGRPAGVAHGSLLDASLVLSVPSLPLIPGRYEWRLEFAQTTEAVSFQVG